MLFAGFLVYTISTPVAAGMLQPISLLIFIRPFPGPQTVILLSELRRYSCLVILHAMY
jgi:hypothetical protein